MWDSELETRMLRLRCPGLAQKHMVPGGAVISSGCGGLLPLFSEYHPFIMTQFTTEVPLSSLGWSGGEWRPGLRGEV